jgi:hypothetical protein
MDGPSENGLAEFAEAIRRARPRGLVDLYLEAVSEAWWRLDHGTVVGHGVLRREGAAARREGQLLSCDGLDRTVLAEVTGAPAARLAPFAFPALLTPPDLEAVRERALVTAGTLRWRTSRAAVVRDGVATAIRRPVLLEVTRPDGQRLLLTWPPREPLADDQPVGESPVAPRPGPTTVLFAPAAAAVLVHELFGHPLEGDALLAGGSPWSGRFGTRVVPLPLDLDDDPTRFDLPGAFNVDDEGTEASVRPLLRAGELVGALSDQACATAFGLPAGNARRASVHAPPRPRLSNLVAGGGSAEPPQRSAARLEVTSLSSGNVQPHSGLLVLTVRTGFALRGGERQRPLQPCTLTAPVAAACDGLRAAGGAPLATAEPGWCSKDGDVLATGAVTPWLLVAGLEAR